MFVSFVDTTDSFPLSLFFIWFVLLSFALHFGSGAYRPGYLGIVALASCTYYGLSLKPSRNFARGQRCKSACRRRSTIRSRMLFYPLRDESRGHLIVDRLFLRWNSTSWTSSSVSLLILECCSHLQVALQMVTAVSSSPCRRSVERRPAL